MQKIVASLLVIAAVFGAAFFLSGKVDFFPRSGLISTEEKKTGSLFSYPLKNHPFAIVITGRNNGAALQKTLASVFHQNYPNFRIIYIDDASNDGSFDLARDMIYESGHLLHTTLVHNQERLGDLANLSRAVQTCSDEEIVVVLNGEDWLSHEWVLQRLNSYYADPDLWMTYGQYRKYPSYQLGVCRPLEEGERLRDVPFIASHLQTFYAGLFKKIRESDFIYQGKFLSAGAELAYMLPMLEMGKDHIQFIPETLYISNSEVDSLENEDLQLRCEKFIRGLHPYQTLTALRFEPEKEEIQP